MSYIVDVLASEVGPNLKKILGPSLFENAEVLKIMHGCQSSDLEWLIRDYGIKTISVYDTQQFHKKFISQKELSLAKMWERYALGFDLIDIEEKKRLQTSNWAQRPLSQDQLDYAVNDTYFLWHIVYS